MTHEPHLWVLCVLQSISAVIKSLSCPGSAVLDHPDAPLGGIVYMCLVMCGQQAQCLEHGSLVGWRHMCLQGNWSENIAVHFSPESYKQRHRRNDDCIHSRQLQDHSLTRVLLTSATTRTMYSGETLFYSRLRAAGTVKHTYSTCTQQDNTPAVKTCLFLLEWKT